MELLLTLNKLKITFGKDIAGEWWLQWCAFNNRSLANMAVPAGQAGDFNQVSSMEWL